jgi:hypothetical protein
MNWKLIILAIDFLIIGFIISDMWHLRRLKKLNKGLDAKIPELMKGIQIEKGPRGMIVKLGDEPERGEVEEMKVISQDLILKFKELKIKEDQMRKLDEEVEIGSKIVWKDIKDKYNLRGKNMEFNPDTQRLIIYKS